ncbi:hypothetical protein GOP47_0010258 [Adiantum capillus-veneris]|uniref:Protein kinase domain-containing protein n=1 Tax=Adiantum capillus-veneris TaxID=13818 RepID=A0A9D4UUT3_ADICA|nr:hypothetical protein GOP47_0010258 [Adiantum capillus-veneris]
MTQLAPKQAHLSLPIDVRDRLQKLQYTYAEVLDITKNLNIKLGEGGFGPVYFGKLKDGSPVAVKKLSSSSAQGIQEFLNEVDVLSRAHHKNLVSLVGYCCEGNERCLIYEFMPKGNLDDRLHGLTSEQEPLNWTTRLRIAVGAAKGFSYLHNDCSPAIIHRDVKCSNILLDKNLDAKVADFGLSKLLSQSALTHITTGVKGTFGYLDPEYAQTERLTEKSDVYAFGVILLELLTGNKAIMQNSGEYVHIAQWARPPIITNVTLNILDSKLGKDIDKDSVQTVANLALHCAASKSIERPSFQDVLQVLEAVLKLEMKLELPQKAEALLATDVVDNWPIAETVIPIVGGQKVEDPLLYAVQKTV